MKTNAAMFRDILSNMQESDQIILERAPVGFRVSYKGKDCNHVFVDRCLLGHAVLPLCVVLCAMQKAQIKAGELKALLWNINPKETK